MTISKTIFLGDLAEVSVRELVWVTVLFRVLAETVHCLVRCMQIITTHGFPIPMYLCSVVFWGVGIYIFTFLYLFFKKKYKEYGLLVEIMALLAIFLFFYGEALKQMLDILYILL